MAFLILINLLTASITLLKEPCPKLCIHDHLIDAIGSRILCSRSPRSFCCYNLDNIDSNIICRLFIVARDSWLCPNLV